ncbi:hypothetical protein BUALT_Bualt11G0112000 [Buddleja alternifolia]|uniref:Uncharacterized protein n=1 Tax=Buddleja alternifolia TaxID=168488 RepID=A0AAV6X2S0_9LAMI|nr:hypothetical protein BUALT_Bualt11G0112000 [Buddleja alternifolia]
MLYFFFLKKHQEKKRKKKLRIILCTFQSGNWNAMEFKARIIGFLILFLLLSGPGFSKARLHVKNAGSDIYEIDYRGPETHTYIPPPNRDRAGPGPGSTIRLAWPVTSPKFLRPNEMGRKLELTKGSD